MNNMKYIFPIFILIALAACNTAPKETNETVCDGAVMFANIADGDTLSSPFLLEMGVEGMTVEPKGEPKPCVGHHHLLINDNFIDEGVVIVADSTHIHYGGGQEMDSISLDPGNYKLTLQFGDGMHVSYGEAWSSTVNVVVK
jgi:hypothetical protein